MQNYQSDFLVITDYSCVNKNATKNEDNALKLALSVD